MGTVYVFRIGGDTHHVHRPVAAGRENEAHIDAAALATLPDAVAYDLMVSGPSDGCYQITIYHAFLEVIDTECRIDLGLLIEKHLPGFGKLIIIDGIDTVSAVVQCDADGLPHAPVHADLPFILLIKKHSPDLFRITGILRQIHAVGVVDQTDGAVQIRDRELQHRIVDVFVAGILYRVEEGVKIFFYIWKFVPVQIAQTVLAEKTGHHIFRRDDDVIRVIQVRVHRLVVFESTIYDFILRVRLLKVCDRIFRDIITPVVDDEFFSSITGRRTDRCE